MPKPNTNPSIIPEALVEATWEEVAVMPEDKAAIEIDRLSKTQPALLAFVFADTEDLSHEAHEIAVYMFFVILRVFEKHFGNKLKQVDIQTVTRLQKEIEQALETLGNADDSALERAAIAQNEAQPFVIRYVVETLFEPDEDEEAELTEEDQGALFLTMKTVTDALNSTIRS
jgi:citrate lyase gamma subunit